MDGWMNERTNGLTDGRTDRRTDGRMLTWTDERIDAWMFRFLQKQKFYRIETCPSLAFILSIAIFYSSL